MGIVKPGLPIIDMGYNDRLGVELASMTKGMIWDPFHKIFKSMETLVEEGTCPDTEHLVNICMSVPCICMQASVHRGYREETRSVMMAAVRDGKSHMELSGTLYHAAAVDLLEPVALYEDR